MSAAIDRPIFVLGPHRSGTTLLYRILAAHPDVACFMREDHRLPTHPRLAHLWAKLARSDGSPVEAQRIWDLRWRRPDDVMVAGDALPLDTAFYRKRVAAVLALRGRPRFAAKYPRLSLRVDWLDAIFPDALFVHMVRDWRAVLASTLVRKRKREARRGGWFGVRVPGWRELGGVSHEEAAAEQYRQTTLALERAAGRFGPRWLRVGYGDLCRDPDAEVRRLADFCALPWTPEFEAAVPRDLRSADHKWKEQLDPRTLDALRAKDPAFFSRYEESAT